MSDQGVEIDAGSLWIRDDDQMILDDEDQHITADYDPEEFSPVED
jgi:hypothetical protein